MIIVEEYEHECHIREQEMAAKFAEDVAAIIGSNQQLRKEVFALANKAAIAARARRARAILKMALKN